MGPQRLCKPTLWSCCMNSLFIGLWICAKQKKNRQKLWTMESARARQQACLFQRYRHNHQSAWIIVSPTMRRDICLPKKYSGDVCARVPYTWISIDSNHISNTHSSSIRWWRCASQLSLLLGFHPFHLMLNALDFKICMPLGPSPIIMRETLSASK